ncbi:hypothetical protein [Histidinibacterium lentulum]|uniref:hypothetical protein n=1 Tax=Histidinibacterium lentulum TaxID=2480588 RepID=UPI000F4C5A42|nr:hypothetical protein [Histidinibacterium lentulum]
MSDAARGRAGSVPPSADGTATGDLVRLGGVDALVLAAVDGAEERRLALLVEPHEAGRVRKAVRGLQRTGVALYTPTGSKGGSFRLDAAPFEAITLSIMPVDLAETLLGRARAGGGLPPEDRALLAAYVTAFFRSPSRLAGGTATEDEAEGARRADVCRDLAAAGWRPPLDMLERLALADPWLRDTLLESEATGPWAEPGLTAFFVRARALERGVLPQLLEVLADLGFETLAEVALDDAASERMRKSTRGGNWGSGPFRVNGGPPRHMIFAFDAFPVPPGAATKRLHPLLDNARTLEVKFAMRDRVEAAEGLAQSFNPLHSSDHAPEALRVAEALLTSSGLEALKARVADRRKALRQATGALAAEPLAGRNLTAACLRRDGGLRRVFRPHLAHHAKDAIEAQRLLGAHPDLCPILAAGEGWIDLADPGPDFAPAGSLAAPLPLALTLRLRALLSEAARAGVVLGRWDPGQALLVDREGTALRLTGFDRPRCLGAPQDLAATLSDPATQAGLTRLTGMPATVFIGGSPLRMRLAREVLRPAVSVRDRGAAWTLRLLAALRARLPRGV